MKPHYQIPIADCGEPLLPIPLEAFTVVQPHPYQSLGAPYGERSPYYLRQSVLARLLAAQQTLQTVRPGWQIQIFDAYRPLAVQQFMVDYTYQQLLTAEGYDPAQLSSTVQQRLLARVYQFWAPPSDNPQMPPPHSTGAAVDVTLTDATQQPVPMGSDIDELSERSYPNYFATRPDAGHYHANRTLLAEIMGQAGFCQHPNEWWHFSYGDQLWAWLRQPSAAVTARYGAAAKR
ncbi:MAG: M15 family metallopeptidase [Leptolyngbya sp. SIO4C1]|nr:M15 family metallopeptidase [Leptolyngbya sp. SIO4C1]